MTASIPAQQRLLNLIIALTSTRHRLTRDQIRASVDGYDPEPSSVDEATRERASRAFERKFERDKDELRSLGIPLRTVVDPVHGDEIGYRIDRDAAVLPDLDLTAAQLAVLRVAVEYWHDAALGAHARHAYTKIASSNRSGPRVELPFAGRAPSAHAATVSVLEAIEERQRVRFDYASASSETLTRTVQPWRVVMRGAVEYLIGYDEDREATRTFRVSRIAGSVRRIGAGGAFDIPADVPLDGLDNHRGTTAVVAVRPEAGHAVRRLGTVSGGDDGWDVVEIEGQDRRDILAAVLTVAGAATVVSPPELAQAVAEHARAALEVTSG